MLLESTPVVKLLPDAKGNPPLGKAYHDMLEPATESVAVLPAQMFWFAAVLVFVGLPQAL